MSLNRGERTAVIVAVLAVIVVIAVGISIYVSGSRQSRLSQCRFNLTRLSMGIHAGKPDDPGWDKMPTGSAFWSACPKWPTDRPFPLDESLLRCPVLAREEGIDYRGPAESIRSLEPEDVIGADRPGNHGPEAGGNVLLKNGRVFETARDDNAWIEARDTTMY